MVGRSQVLSWQELTQAELVAAMADLRRGHRVEFVPKERESLEEAWRRALGFVEKRELKRRGAEGEASVCAGCLGSAGVVSGRSGRVARRGGSLSSGISYTCAGWCL